MNGQLSTVPFPVKGLLQSLSQLLKTALGDRAQGQLSYLGGESLAFVDPARTRPRCCFASKANGYVWSPVQPSQKGLYNQEIDELHVIVLIPSSASF